MALRILELLDHVRFDALAGSGHSGLLLLGALSYRLGIPVLAVRKGPSDSSHDYRLVNGYLGSFGKATEYLIIDDLIDTGKTINRIIGSIEEEVPDAVPVGVLTYQTPYRFAAFKSEFEVSIPTFHLTPPPPEPEPLKLYRASYYTRIDPKLPDIDL